MRRCAESAGTSWQAAAISALLSVLRKPKIGPDHRKHASTIGARSRDSGKITDDENDRRTSLGIAAIRGRTSVLRNLTF
jgi:hypothetical protein